MHRHTRTYTEWQQSSEEDKYAQWSDAVLSLGIGLDYGAWCQLHEAELRVAANIEEEMNTSSQHNEVS